jgi:hypothetical protein
LGYSSTDEALEREGERGEKGYGRRAGLVPVTFLPLRTEKQNPQSNHFLFLHARESQLRLQSGFSIPVATGKREISKL